MQADNIFDIIILGAGPSGLACAIMLRDSGLKVALIDKESFPRDKTCGDGLTLDAVKQLQLISEDLYVRFLKLEHKQPNSGVTVFSNSGYKLHIPISYNSENRSMYTVKRSDFDNMLLQYVKDNTHTIIIEECKAQDIRKEKESIQLITDKGIFNSRMIIGADGAESLVRNKLHGIKIPEKDKYIALRCYFKNLCFSENNNPMYFYFNPVLLPGGLWIFPGYDNIYNVGLGMRLKTMKKKKLNLKNVLENEIHNGLLKDQFINGEQISELKGHIIPIGRKGRKISGAAYVLTGDAAGLANPLSGEGIGNALRSGRVAAAHIIRCFQENNFSENFNKKYDKEIYKRMGREFINNNLIEYLNSFPAINNYIIQKWVPRFIKIFSRPEYINKIQSKSLFSPATLWLLLRRK